MDLSRQLKSTALVLFLITIVIHSSHTRYHGRRLKRQHGAHMYLPESYIIPGGNSSDPNEWGPWSSPSECSRSCGGGVSYQSRDCLNFSPQGSPICQGGNRKYFSCNTQDCPEDEVDFRAQQCSRFNHIPFESVRYEWVPYTKAPNPCELNCMPRGERFYFRHKSKVIDGTRCNDESLDVCVDGQCQSVGCDMMLGSPAREDKCRRCAGDGTSCRTVKGLLDMNNLQVGYNDLLLIPAGATNIIIKEIAPSNNYLACRNLTGHYYLNGNWRIDFPRPMQFAGAWWHYDRRPQGFAAPDHLTCIGPTAEAIYLVLLYQDRNVGIAYEYSVPESVAQSRDPDSYSWTHTSYGPCSASCGTGYQTRVVTCNSRSSLEQVEDGLCDAAIKPADTAQCGQEDCAPHWVEGPWSKCSKPCGSDGKQERTVHCEKIESNGVAAIAEDSVCLKQAGNKPATVQECNIGLKCPKWHVGPWRACNQLCGDGEEKRQIICFTVENGKKKVLPDSECPEEKPEDSKKCMLQPCEGVDWITSSWSGCHECGLTQETRTAICASKDGKIFNDTFCPTEKPELTRPCKTTVCEFQWFASEWSKCSANCGKGVQTRIVLCGQFIEDVVKPATDDSKCDSASKPEVSQECEGEKKDCPGQWFAGPWGNCDKPCGGGERKREVLCMADGKVVSNCDAETIEFSSEKCNPDPCTADETLPITITSKSIEEDDEGEDLCEDEDSDDLDSMEDKSKDSLKLPEGIDLDNTKPTETSLVTDELMQSDGPGLESPAGVDTSDLLITSEGSGDDVSSSSASSTTIEGSGDYDEESSTQSSTEFTVETSSSSESTAITGVLGSSTDGSTSSDSSSETEVTSSEESTISGATEITSSDLTSSKDASASTESGLETTSSSSEESSDSTVTDISGPTTQSQSSISSDVSSTSSSLEASTPSGVTDGSTTSSSSDGSTASGSSDGSTVSSSSDGSTASSSSDGSTVSSSSDGSTVSSSSDGSTASSSSGGSTESTSSDGSSISTSSDESTSTLDGSTASSETESTGPTESTESPEPTESTGPTESTESTQSTEPSQSTEPTQSTEFASTDLSKSTDSSSEATTISGSDSTDGSSPGSTEETSIGSTGATDLSSEPTSISGSEATTDGSSLGTTEDSVSGSTVSSLEGTTLASTESGTDTTNTETTESGSTVVSTDVTTGSTESGSTGVSTDVTAESTESRSTEISTGETTESTESGSTGVSTDITGESTTSLSSTDETTSSVTGTTDTSDGTDTTPTSGETDTTAISDETDTTDTSGETTEASSLSTDVSGSTESTVEISTVSESSTSETEGSSTESSGGTDETTIDIWSTSGSETTDEDLFGSTPNTLQAVVTKEQTPRRCKLKKKKAPCLVSKFGCCSDNSTAAKGPFDEGCPIIHTCKDTKYGCCPDEVSPAQGENDEGCPRPPCEGSLFGCCPDGSTEAEGEENEGCPEEITTTTVGGCATSKHGCCPDGETEASGPDNEGCDECVGEECTTIVSETTEQSQETEETSEPDETTMGLDVTTMEPPKESCSYSKYGCCPDGETEATGEEFAGCLGAGPQDCNKSEHGCCRDNRTPAAGPNQEGCSPCLAEPFGCCRDGQTPAHGPNQEGCCLDTRFGCCPDNVNAARGPDFEGCSCEYAPYGCCPDNKTASRGYNKEGCDCKDSEFGCCLDKVTPAKGAKLEGCPCHTFQFGCCPDGTTTAKGPHNYGCQCQQTEFKCCLDEKTAAKGPNFEGCTCLTSRYGCCPDGVSTALGENFEECENVKVAPEKACSLKKDSGPCNNYTVKHFFDTEYGACARFWYGGCDGNGNRFDSIEDCKRTCEQPAGKGACLLPKVAGPCPGYYKKFYYDADRKTCAEFIYGGCLGNNNKFDTIEECQSTCAADETLPPCEQPMEQGPCEGSFERWFYDNQTDVCRPFTYGGCKGNKNNYPSENACQYHCKHPGVHKESCALPKEIGGVECGGRHARWHYSETDKKCMPFYYSGCGGNTNSFVSLEQCEENCPRQVAKDLCEIPAEVGDCANYTARWYYDTANAQCRQFYYGGCGGNQNNFVTEDSCYQRCEPKPEEPKTEVPVAQTEPEPGFSSHNCYLPVQNGPCDQYQERWHYNSDHGVCEHFMYTGCGGNANNFVSEEDCENSCLHVQHTCTLRPLFGNCQDNTTRWYFDERTRHCHEFEFSGCGGNRNNFFNEKECLNFCGQGEEEPPTQGPDIDSRFDETEYSVCDAPLQQGNCREEIAAWFYSREHGQCVAFRYTGCGGNGNRFESQEQCERQCGRYKGVDVCHEEVSPGSCDQWQTRYYFDQSQRLCQPFTYGGCEGTGNRFVSQAECESVCIVHEEPSPMDNKAICALPAASGNCYGPESAKRWYYDDSRGTCVSFIFTGCAGNQNNFRSFESCINFCINTTTAVHVDPGELRTSAPNECQGYQEACRMLQCPYGVGRSHTSEGCERCSCDNPCQNTQCAEGSACAVDIASAPEGTQFIPVCRETNKPGECPSLNNTSSRCGRECRTDADCRNDNKCCSDGCGYVCVRPMERTAVTTSAPRVQVVYPGDRAPALEDKRQEEVNVDTPEGGYATLRCFATGNPPPTITWQRGGIIIDTNQGRFLITSTGDLQIVQVIQSDNGTYVCIADNGIGAPIRREVQLQVTEPRPTDVYILSPRNTTKIVTLTQPARLRCPAGGNPKPLATWWKGQTRIPLMTAAYEQQRDFSLIINSVKLSDLGTYTCEAYAGHGRPTSIKITLKATGPVHVSDESEKEYLKYIIEPKQAPVTEKPKPRYPYRPVRPTDRPIPKPEIPRPAAPGQNIPNVPASAHLRLPSGNSFALGADILMECDVGGSPTPNVTWFKDNALLEPSNKIQITEQPYRLVVYGATLEDSGDYKCNAANSFSINYHQERILVEGVYVHPDCKDNPFFANCKLIVKGLYCSNHYYAKFCCRSCTLAGQIAGSHPNSI